MKSAFGIEHISKSWGKTGPKLARSGSFIPRETDDIGQRMRVNYSQWREKSGYLQRDIKNYKKVKTYEDETGRQVPMHPRILENRERSLVRTQEKARNLKEGSKAAAAGYSAQARRKRVLP